MRILIFTLLTVSWLALTFTFAQERTTKKAAVQESLVTAEGDYVINDFHFVDGESLPELTLHYRTIGQPVRNPLVSSPSFRRLIRELGIQLEARPRLRVKEDQI